MPKESPKAEVNDEEVRREGDPDGSRWEHDAYLWLVGNGRMVVMVLIIVPIPPFPTNQR